MPYCTIEEAWGENIYHNNKSDQEHNQELIFTNNIESSTEKDYLRSKDHSEFVNDEEDKQLNSKDTMINDTNKFIGKNDIDTMKKNKDILSLESYIDKLKKENEELKNIISSKNIKDNLEKNSIKFKLIDIVIYLLTGIFIIFIIDLIFKHKPHKTVDIF
tara:strand:- start:73 stop:552 length:480 start_codon:yes stop_codon:yes gene_type:complete